MGGAANEEKARVLSLKGSGNNVDGYREYMSKQQRNSGVEKQALPTREERLFVKKILG